MKLSGRNKKREISRAVQEEVLEVAENKENIMDDSWKEVSKEKLLEEIGFQGEIVKEFNRRHIRIVILIDKLLKDLERFDDVNIKKIIDKYRKKLLED